MVPNPGPQVSGKPENRRGSLERWLVCSCAHEETFATSHFQVRIGHRLSPSHWLFFVLGPCYDPFSVIFLGSVSVCVLCAAQASWPL